MELRQFPRDRDFFPETETFFSRPSRDRDIRVPRPSRDRDTRVPRPSRDRDREVPRPSRDRDICKKSRDRAETFKNLSRDCLEPRHLSRGLHHWIGQHTSVIMLCCGDSRVKQECADIMRLESTQLVGSRELLTAVTVSEHNQCSF